MGEDEDPIYPAWIEAARMTGLPVTEDYNGKSAVGFRRSQYSIRNDRRCGVRVSAAGHETPHHREGARPCGGCG
jgi:choline dehydrogenase-like flavoprotein